ncbi:MAG: PfkB family carbohydrate kinase [Gemmataceae bacterium]|jgi:sugar/nucleoside kinase (ribokinase family)
MSDNKIFDVLGMGCVAVDEILRIPKWPEQDTKVRLTHYDRQCGGLTGNALVAASRFGANCAFAGHLGLDSNSDFVKSSFLKENINLDHVPWKTDSMPIHSFIIVDESNDTRTILFHLNGSTGAPAESPPEEVILSSKVLFVDHYGIEGMIRSAKIARRAGIPVVADLERNEWQGFDELLSLVDHLIISIKFARKISGCSSPGAIAHKLFTPGKKVVVVTGGEEGCWYVEENRILKHFPAFKVKAIDTTGCGDVFHGVYSACLAAGLPIHERIKFASGAAAMKSLHPGAQKGAPTKDQVIEFLKTR